MQEETTSTGYSQQENTNSEVADAQTYDSFTSNQEILSALNSEGFNSPSGLEVSILKTLKDGCSVIVYGKRCDTKVTNSIIAATLLCSNSEVRIIFGSNDANSQKTGSATFKKLSFDTASVKKPKDSKVAFGSLDEIDSALNESDFSPSDFDLLFLDVSTDSEYSKDSALIKNLIKKYLDLNPNGQALVCLTNADSSLASEISSASGGLTPVEINANKYGTVETVHQYYEIVSNDLLSKPNALCDILQAENVPAAAIFCNTPSDADLLDAILAKRGISSRKLIGNIPYHIAKNAVADCTSGRYEVLVVTDISGQQMDLGELELIVNYSIHSDANTYLKRMGKDGGQEKVISLVTPLDFGNFHFLKKVVKSEFIKCELPSAEVLASAKFNKLCKDARAATLADQEACQSLLAQILEHEDKDTILTYLVHNTISEIPELKQQGGRKRGPKNDRDRDFRENRSESSHDRRHYQDEGDDNNFDRNSKREHSEPVAPPNFDYRYYLGQGLEHEFTEDKLIELIKSKTDQEADVIKRVSIRDFYSFVDFDEKIAETLVNQLADAELDGNKLVLLKAASIAQPREKQESSDSMEAAELETAEVDALESEEIAANEEE
ncbi:MAG: DEAD/DEAH box helicase [Bdellovibrionales bacterium]|nr:DEAD/DEAH box helicase [Bdellovibrionales bacterium]